jgi:rhodanese-related sulfurtransferase
MAELISMAWKLHHSSWPTLMIAHSGMRLTIHIELKEKKIMKKVAKLLLLMTLFTPAAFAGNHGHADKVGVAAPKAQSYKAQSPKIDRAKLDALLAKPDQLLIIDLRRPDEISKIGGFPVYLNVQFADLENSLASIPKDRTIVTVSNHAGRSGRAADLLAGKGFHVAGWAGAQYYEEEGGKLTKIAPPAPKK